MSDTNTPTDEEVIRCRQAACKHAFARGMADRAAHCVHCGLPESDYTQAQSPYQGALNFTP